MVTILPERVSHFPDLSLRTDPGHEVSLFCLGLAERTGLRLPEAAGRIGFRLLRPGADQSPVLTQVEKEAPSRRMPGKSRSQLCAGCSKRTSDPGDREPPKMFGARVPVIQRKKHPTNEDNRRNQHKVGLKPGRPEQGEEGIAPEVQGRHRQARSTIATQRRQRPSRSVFGSMIAELVAHAGDNPDDARDRGEDREKPEGFRAVETGDDRGCQDGDEPRATVVPVTSLRTSAAKEDEREGSGIVILYVLAGG